MDFVTDTAVAPERSARVEPRTRARRRRRAWLAALSLAVSLLAVEGALRAFLFADALRDTPLARRLRREELWAPPQSAEYWTLEARFRRPVLAARPHPLYDARLGWRSEEIDQVTLAHVDESRVGERRPVLLFGDSFAQCVQRAEKCWQELLEESDLAPDYALLNYGVGGYGLDQAVMLARLVVPRFAERRPLVVMAILVDDDLDRSFLRLRGHPKPWFALEDGALVAHQPVAESPLAFVQTERDPIGSYLWRYVVRGARWFGDERAERWTASGPPVEEREALCERVLVAFQGEMAAQGVELVFLLLHGQGQAAVAEPPTWAEPFLRRTFAAHAMPFTSAKGDLRADAETNGRGIASYYFTEGRGLNHFNDLGNTVAFGALRRGIVGEFERDSSASVER